MVYFPDEILITIYYFSACNFDYEHDFLFREPTLWRKQTD